MDANLPGCMGDQAIAKAIAKNIHQFFIVQSLNFGDWNWATFFKRKNTFLSFEFLRADGAVRSDPDSTFFGRCHLGMNDAASAFVQVE